ncbi:thiamine pyrophosphate-dependent enzyme [Kineococcus sp. SYSU DK001]|uniref:thiamine pyrophosphate-dependent enzyme n=1 Tax=Kineococcus sp. SYSU DK001 TaxID=3383122 RepID=UPI003D7CFB40
MNSPTARTRTTAEAFVEQLIAQGVDTVFGIPGVQTYPLFDALARVRDQIEVVVPRHEQACAYMAMGYAQSTGRPGVCSVVPGPGILNAAAGLLTAAGTSTPVVCLTGEVPTPYMGRGLGHVHEMPDQLGTLRSFLKHAENVLHPAQAGARLAEAFAQATSGRPGPVAVAAPWDVLGASAPVPEPTTPHTHPAPQVAAGDLAAAADLLRAARNPMIMVGSGARGAAEEVRRLAELLQAPVVSLRGGRGVVANSHPLGFTCAEGFTRWADTDLLLSIGTRRELEWFRWPDRPAGLRTVNVDIDPRQQARLRPDVGLTGDAAQVTRGLLDVLGPEAGRPDRTGEFARARAGKRAEIARLKPHADHLAAIRAALPADGFFVEEVSQVGFSSYFAFDVEEPRRFITSGHQSTLGFGFPTALGVKAAHRTSPVVSVTGDGGFQFALQELATAVQFGLGVVTVVFDNGAYGNVRADQQRLFGRPFASDLRNPDLLALARSFGAEAVQAQDPDALGDAVEAALAKDLPTVVHVPMPLDMDRSPWPFLAPAPTTRGA